MCSSDLQTNQPWPVLLPDQPPASAWKQIIHNREAALQYLMQVGILDEYGQLLPMEV